MSLCDDASDESVWQVILFGKGVTIFEKFCNKLRMTGIFIWWNNEWIFVIFILTFNGYYLTYCHIAHRSIILLLRLSHFLLKNMRIFSTQLRSIRQFTDILFPFLLSIERIYILNWLLYTSIFYIKKLYYNHNI